MKKVNILHDLRVELCSAYGIPMGEKARVCLKTGGGKMTRMLRKACIYVVSLSLLSLLFANYSEIRAEEEVAPKQYDLIAASSKDENKIVYVSREHLLLLEGSKLRCYSANEGKMIYERDVVFQVKGDSGSISVGTTSGSKTVFIFQWFECTDDDQTSYVLAYEFLDVPNNKVSAGQIKIDNRPKFNTWGSGVLFTHETYLCICGWTFRIIVDLSRNRVQRVADILEDECWALTKDKLYAVSFREVKCVWNIAEWKEADPDDTKQVQAIQDRWLLYKYIYVYPQKDGYIVLFYPKFKLTEPGIPSNIFVGISFLDNEWNLRKEYTIMIRCLHEIEVVEDAVIAVCGKGKNESTLTSVKVDGIAPHGENEYRYENVVYFMGTLAGDILMGCMVEEKIYRIDKNTLNVVGTYDMNEWPNALRYKYDQADSEICTGAERCVFASSSAAGWLKKVSDLYLYVETVQIQLKE